MLVILNTDDIPKCGTYTYMKYIYMIQEIGNKVQNNLNVNSNVVSSLPL